jgi:hypothetical protein
MGVFSMPSGLKLLKSTVPKHCLDKTPADAGGTEMSGQNSAPLGQLPHHRTNHRMYANLFMIFDLNTAECLRDA